MKNGGTAVSESLKPCPCCGSENVKKDNKLQDGWVDCLDCDTEAPLSSWQADRIGAKKESELTTKLSDLEREVSHLKGERLRVRHMDAYFDSHKVQFDHFIKWLRENPYPEED